MQNVNDPYLEKYREKLMKWQKSIVEYEMDNLRERCIGHPILTIGCGILTGVMGFVMCKIPLLSIIVMGFHLQYLLYSIAIICCVIGFFWFLIGMITYKIKKNSILKEYEKKLQELRNYMPDDVELAMWEVIDEHPEYFRNNNQHSRMISYQKNDGCRLNKEGFSYENEIDDSAKRNFLYVDASGAYRRWGEAFVDCRGNWCSWGSGFYDVEGNYITWGNMYKDSSGAYRRWGDDFVDGAGNYIRCP